MNIIPHPRQKNVYPIYFGALLQFLKNVKAELHEDLTEPDSFGKKCRSLQSQFDAQYMIANKVSQSSGHAALRRSIPYLERLIWYWLKDENPMLLEIVKEEFIRQINSNKCDKESAGMLKTQILEIFGPEAFSNPDENDLKFVQTEQEIVSNTYSFNNGLISQSQIATTLIQQSTYFVYDQSTSSFAPGKFVGLKDMTLSRYQSLLDSRERSWKFDGYRTRKAIEDVLGIGFFSSSELDTKLRQWSAKFDAIVKDNVQFCVVESPPEHPEDPPIEAQKLSKPFMLLAGISGTGKTRFVREQAKLTNPNGWLEDTYCLVSVRPDWHEPSDLLGYTTRLSGKAEYVVTDVLHFIVQAWKELLRCGIRLEEGVVLGSQDQLTRVRPFWLCLDEMNLAPVEQYFADYLSILETREWEWSENEFTYRCDSLLKSTIFNDFFDEERFAVQNNLGLHDNEGLWEFFQQNGIAIPPNLVVVGTVNMDETTHGFSRKVLDRALTIDFGEFYPNDFDAFFHPQTKSKIFSFPHMSNSSMHRHFCSVDPDGKKSIQFLKTINAVLKDTTFELAFRALNELLLSVQSHTIEDEATLQAVWDDFLMSKVLPRIEGDLEKLAKAGSENTLLTSLQTVLAENLSAIWMDTARPDLHRETMDGGTILISCRSRQKLEWMSKRLDQFGFTTFWP